MRSWPLSDLQLMWDRVSAVPFSPGQAHQGKLRLAELAAAGEASESEWEDLLGGPNKHLRRNNWCWSLYSAQHRERERETNYWT